MPHSPEIEDEIMLEMRALKEEFAARFDYDFDAISKYLMEEQKKLSHRLDQGQTGNHLREWEEKNKDKVTVRGPRHP